MGQVDAGSETDQVSLVKPTKAQVKLDNSHVTKAKKEEAVLTKKPKVSDKGKAVKVDPSKSAKVERKDTKNQIKAIKGELKSTAKDNAKVKKPEKPAPPKIIDPAQMDPGKLKIMVDTEVAKKMEEIKQKEAVTKASPAVKKQIKAEKKVVKKEKEIKKKEEKKAKVEQKVEEEVEKKRKCEAPGFTPPMPPLIVHANPGWPYLGPEGGMNLLPPSLLPKAAPAPAPAAAPAPAPAPAAPKA